MPNFIWAPKTYPISSQQSLKLTFHSSYNQWIDVNFPDGWGGQVCKSSIFSTLLESKDGANQITSSTPLDLEKVAETTPSWLERSTSRVAEVTLISMCQLLTAAATTVVFTISSLLPTMATTLDVSASLAAMSTTSPTTNRLSPLMTPTSSAKSVPEAHKQLNQCTNNCQFLWPQFIVHWRHGQLHHSFTDIFFGILFHFFFSTVGYKQDARLHRQNFTQAQ